MKVLEEDAVLRPKGRNLSTATLTSDCQSPKVKKDRKKKKGREGRKDCCHHRHPRRAKKSDGGCGPSLHCLLISTAQESSQASGAKGTVLVSK